MLWIYDDGGRIASGRKGHHLFEPDNYPGDCVARAIAIAGEYDYDRVCNLIDNMICIAREEINGYEPIEHCSSQTGVDPFVFRTLFNHLGWQWYSQQKHLMPSRVAWIGQDNNLGEGYKSDWRGKTLAVNWPRIAAPKGRYVCRLAKHVCAVIDGDLYDVSDRRSERIYGYWKANLASDLETERYLKGV